MILKITLYNRSYNQIIEKYLDDGGCFVATYFKNAVEYEEFISNVEKFNCRRGYNSRMLREELENAIYRNFINYINQSVNNVNWHTINFDNKELERLRSRIINLFEVKVKTVLVDIPCNMEAVYYIDTIRKYVVM